MPHVDGPANRLTRMRNNDPLAVRETLQQHGAALDAVLLASGAEPAQVDALVVVAAKALWAAAALMRAPPDDDRPLLLACGLAARPNATLLNTDLDAALVTRLCARVIAGVASLTERNLLHAQRAADPRIDAVAVAVEAAHQQIRDTPIGPGRGVALWDDIVGSLK